MATLAVVALSHNFQIGQTTGTVEFFSMPYTAGGDPSRTVESLGSGRSDHGS